VRLREPLTLASADSTFPDTVLPARQTANHAHFKKDQCHRQAAYFSHGVLDSAWVGTLDMVPCLIFSLLAKFGRAAE
jgi:putative copper export protein